SSDGLHLRRLAVAGPDARALVVRALAFSLPGLCNQTTRRARGDSASPVARADRRPRRPAPPRAAEDVPGEVPPAKDLFRLTPAGARLSPPRRGARPPEAPGERWPGPRFITLRGPRCGAPRAQREGFSNGPDHPRHRRRRLHRRMFRPPSCYRTPG